MARGLEIEEQLAVIAGQENRLLAQTVGLVAEAIEDGHCLAPDLPVRRWIAWRFGSSASKADKIATIAERRRELPALMGALADGAVSLDQAVVIARRVPASHEATATEKAKVMRPSQLRRWAGTTPPIETDETAEPTRRARHHFSVRPAADGQADGDWLVRGRLPGEVGAGLDVAMRAQLDALWAAHQRGEAVGNDLSDAPTALDALARLVEVAQASEAVERPHSQRTKVLLHVDVDAKVGRFHLGPAVPASLRRYLSCDATFQTVFEKAGVALGIGTTSRTIPARTRMVIEQRDGGCRVSGCGRTHVQIHHVVHWEDGGPTETSNLIALCPHHHRMHHQGRLEITATDADDPNGIHFSVGGRELVQRPPPVTGDALPAPPDGAAYCRPEWGRIPNWAMVAPPPFIEPEPRPPRTPAVRIGRDGEPIDFPEVIVLDDDELE